MMDATMCAPVRVRIKKGTLTARKHSLKTQTQRQTAMQKGGREQERSVHARTTETAITPATTAQCVSAEAPQLAARSLQERSRSNGSQSAPALRAMTKTPEATSAEDGPVQAHGTVIQPAKGACNGTGVGVGVGVRNAVRNTVRNTVRC